MTAIIVILICEALLILFFLYSLWSIVIAAPFYPSRLKHLEEAFQTQKISLSGNFVDIGAGDGRIARWAAKKGFRSYGVEANPFLTLYARTFNIFTKNKVTHINKNFNDVTFQKYNIVYIYLFPKLMDVLEKKLWEELKPGTIIIANTFSFKNKKPFATYKRILFYKI